MSLEQWLFMRSTKAETYRNLRMKALILEGKPNGWQCI